MAVTQDDESHECVIFSLGRVRMITAAVILVLVGNLFPVHLARRFLLDPTVNEPGIGYTDVLAIALCFMAITFFGVNSWFLLFRRREFHVTKDWIRGIVAGRTLAEYRWENLLDIVGFGTPVLIFRKNKTLVASYVPLWRVPRRELATMLRLAGKNPAMAGWWAREVASWRLLWRGLRKGFGGNRSDS